MLIKINVCFYVYEGLLSISSVYLKILMQRISPMPAESGVFSVCLSNPYFAAAVF